MQRPCSSLSILILAFFLVGCAPSANAQSADVEAAEQRSSTGLPPKPTPVDTATLEVVPRDPPASCPITVRQDPLFTPPSPYDTMGFEGEFWYGSNSLWTAIRENGTWEALPHNLNGYTQKVFWWHDGYVWNEEPEPDLTVIGERLDASAPPLVVSKATNAYASDIGSAMLVGVDFPTLGCWKITGKYGDAELSFVVWVAL
jgi:hypothetical protein